MRTVFACAFFALSSVVACSAEAPPVDPDPPVRGIEAPAPATPLAQVDAGEGRYITFYDLGDGVHGIAESGPIGTKPRLEGVELSGRSLASIYEELLPGKPVPALIEQAGTQAGTAESMTSGPSPGWGPAEPADVGVARQAVSWDEFVQGGACNCSVLGARIDLQFCLGNRYGDFWAEKKVDIAHFTVAHQSGNGVQLNGFISGTLRIAQWVAPGYWHNFVLRGPKDVFGDRLARTMRYEVSQTPGDVYHVSGCFVTD